MTLSGRRTGPDERGASLSAFVAVVVVALLAMGGLAIDGGAQSAARRECQQVATEAARAASDAGALLRASGRAGDADEMRAAALAVLAAHPGLSGGVTVAAGQIRVEASRTVDTSFLSLVGIGTLRASGQAEAALEGTG